LVAFFFFLAGLRFVALRLVALRFVALRLVALRLAALRLVAFFLVTLRLVAFFLAFFFRLAAIYPSKERVIFVDESQPQLPTKVSVSTGRTSFCSRSSPMKKDEDQHGL
jgi:hypothetical protein